MVLLDFKQILHNLLPVTWLKHQNSGQLLCCKKKKKIENRVASPDNGTLTIILLIYQSENNLKLRNYNQEGGTTDNEKNINDNKSDSIGN